ncbi:MULTISPECIES: ThuA domain-containing protein [Streptomyces]|uniref:ThuA domain-containing protein n=2 Tax=Streptomyces TaxID=1883 RepID=A0ABW6YNQ5_9ACTN|nr:MULTISPECIES: ThuA domain-containing protein [Streptomyces]MCL3996476.1 ThuA domain-containing protein [Streptomyces lavenduligriseus]QIS71244.1 ThuA domain-containing protein [Streptomyces sp. DSM 40868]WDM12438.1 ThuA domain-containing protein [Streptomyces lavenduligriseus]
MTRALYLYGGWPGHKPYEVAEWALAEMRDLGLSVDTINDPYRLEEDLTGYDLIVIGWTQAHTTETLTPRQEDSLLHAVENGTGVAGWHGMAASFRASLRYNHLVGGNCVSHPGGEGVEVPYKVTITDPAHEVTASVSDFEVASEQYYMHVDPANHVLAETVFSGEHLPWIEGQRMPVAWVRRWGAGRVFYCSVGHYLKDLTQPDATRLVRQGIGWAARRGPQR